MEMPIIKEEILLKIYNFEGFLKTVECVYKYIIKVKSPIYGEKSFDHTAFLL